jgi:catechol 2,3-dioxygenase-like lactoylglutathione lyase family enzyme
MTHDHDDHEHFHGPKHFHGVVPVFLVDDVEATAQYYRDVLGFEVDFVWGDDASYGRVVRDDAIIDFVRAEPQGTRNSIASPGAARGTDALIVVSDVEEVYIEIQERGASVIERLAAREYGMLDCMIEDLNGYRLTIGGGLEDDLDDDEDDEEDA